MCNLWRIANQGIEILIMADYELGNRDFEIWLALHILFLVNNLARKIANLVEIAMKKKKEQISSKWAVNIEPCCKIRSRTEDNKISNCVSSFFTKCFCFL